MLHEIIQYPIPLSNKKARPGIKMDPVSLTIHETGNTSRGADALAHAKYFANVEKSVSCHYVVDDHEIIQLIPINEIAWHAGDGVSGPGNNTSIAIEICINSDGNFEIAKENTRDLVQYLMKETGIKEIYSHQHWSGKNCPANILKSGWNEFVNFLHVGYYNNPVDGYKEIIQKECKFNYPDDVWGVFDNHPYYEALYKKIAEAIER